MNNKDRKLPNNTVETKLEKIYHSIREFTTNILSKFI